MQQINFILNIFSLEYKNWLLELDSGYMLSIENMTQDWSVGKHMDVYHDKQLHSLKLAAKVHEDNKSKNGNGWRGGKAYMKLKR